MQPTTLDAMRERVRAMERQLAAVLARFPDGPPPQAHPDQWFGGRTYSQHGEDLVFQCLFQALGIARPSYLDIGAHHPFHISNTALMYERGSRGVNVEANPVLLQAFLEHRPEDINLHLAVAPEPGRQVLYMIDERSGRNTLRRDVAEAFVAQDPRHGIRGTREVEAVTLDTLVARHCGGRYPDLLTLDVEGLDFAILRSADFGDTGPKVICVETAHTCGDDAQDIDALLRGRGYFRAFRAVCNAVYVDERYREQVM